MAMKINTIVDGREVTIAIVKWNSELVVNLDSTSYRGYKGYWMDGEYWGYSPIRATVSRKGEGEISASVVGGDVCELEVEGTVVTFSGSDYSKSVVRISVSETEDYISEYKDIIICFDDGKAPTQQVPAAAD